MKGLFRLARELQSFMEGHGWRFCFIGGLALQRWGENRLTNDVDVCLLTGFGGESGYVEQLVGRYSGRVPDVFDFALKHRVLLLKEKGIGIDISLAAMPFEEDIITRSSCFEFLSDLSLRTCSAEDLIVLKAFANRAQDWVDIRGVMVRQGNRLDFKQVYEELEPLVELKEEPEILETLKQLGSDLGFS